MAPEIELHIRDSIGTQVYGCTGPTGLVDLVHIMIAHLDDVECRNVARRKLLRRLLHPEFVGLNEGSPTLEGDSVIHPKAGTRLAAHDGGPVCVCGSPLMAHDIDGQRNDCHGYVEAR